MARPQASARLAPSPLYSPGLQRRQWPRAQGRGLPALARTSCPETEQRLPPTLCTAGAIPSTQLEGHKQLLLGAGSPTMFILGQGRGHPTAEATC